MFDYEADYVYICEVKVNKRIDQSRDNHCNYSQMYYHFDSTSCYVEK